MDLKCTASKHALEYQTVLDVLQQGGVDLKPKLPEQKKKETNNYHNLVSILTMKNKNYTCASKASKLTSVCTDLSKIAETKEEAAAISFSSFIIMTYFHFSFENAKFDCH